MRKPRTLAFTLSTRILVCIKVNPGIGAEAITLALDASKPSVQTIISRHCKAGLIKQVSLVDGFKGWAVADWAPKAPRRARPSAATIPKQNIFSALGL